MLSSAIRSDKLKVEKADLCNLLNAMPALQLTLAPHFAATGF